MEMENGHYVSDLGKTALSRKIPHKDICWGMGENSDRQFLFCSGKFQCFCYSAAMKVWRKYRLLAEMPIDKSYFLQYFQCERSECIHICGRCMPTWFNFVTVFTKQKNFVYFFQEDYILL